MSAARCWRPVEPQPGYPAAIPLRGEHFAAAWDYAGPAWDGHPRKKPGVFARFHADGTQSSIGMDGVEYKLDPAEV